jgi:hypothetical protein
VGAGVLLVAIKLEAGVELVVVALVQKAIFL